MSARSRPTSPTTKSRCRISAAYTEENFFDDMARITQYRTDPDLCEILVKQQPRDRCAGCATRASSSRRTTAARPIKINGRFGFWGGAILRRQRRRPGLVEFLYKAAEKRGIKVGATRRG